MFFASILYIYSIYIYIYTGNSVVFVHKTGNIEDQLFKKELHVYQEYVNVDVP